ncbi:hypothetical protein ACLKA7_007679 [Drosophila subpalustris]
MTYVLTGEVKQRGRGAVQGMRTSVPPTTRAAQHNYSISGHHKRASSRRLFFSALDHQVTSRSPLKHALASVTQLTTACALHLGAFALSPRGLDNIKTTVPLEMREAEGDDIIATRCRLGWAVYGRAVKDDATIPRLLHICQCSEARGMDDALKNYFSLESLGITATSSPLRSKDDEHAMKIMEATTSFREKEKRRQTGLLWKFDRVVLPDSY